MHPFFQKASSKANGQRPSPPKSEGLTSSTEDTQSPSADSRFYDDSTADSLNSVSPSQLGTHSSQKTANDDERTTEGQDQIETGHPTDLGVDLNVDRRKRRKLASSTESRGLSQGKETDWLHQLEEAAVDGSEPASEVLSAADVSPNTSPKTKETSLRPPATLRRTPRKTRPKTSSVQNSKPSRTTGAASPGNSALATSPTAKSTPKKKVLKLNRNGKLLSSPSLASPQSRGKRATEEDKREVPPKSRRIVFKYRTNEEGRSRLGIRIDEILNSSGISNSAQLPQTDAPTKPTHPFFLGKLAQDLQPNVDGGPDGRLNEDHISESEDNPSPIRKPVAWKDIVFKAQKPKFAKTQDAVGACWPAKEIQHLGAAASHVLPNRPWRLRGETASKSKEARVDIKSSEDVLRNFLDSLRSEDRSATSTFRIPQRIVTTGQQMLAMLETPLASEPDETRLPLHTHPAIAQVRSLLPTTSTAFDQGKSDVGTAWTVKHAPQTANEVLQPAAPQLRDWMRSLITSVTQKMGEKTTQTSKKAVRKKKRRKTSGELHDFIASSEGEAEGIYDSAVKNAVLISGPAGCGKTASVFAVAKELDFEIFEMHPGMRRSAKDIFDKVGEMTQNHLVQGIGDGSGTIPIVNTNDVDFVNQGLVSGKQGTMKKFFTSKTQTTKQRRSPQKTSSEVVEIAKAPKAQRQSAILLEEVDILFDEDKGFWNGVIALISQSKRPVILTCNDESSIPCEELSLHAIWRYEPPTANLASEYLISLAAQEGHILDRDCVKALYRSKGHDLRATIADLNFWCQMGIGSRKGGLDWMLDHSSTEEKVTTNGNSLRVFSKDTYASEFGLALTSQVSEDYQQEALLEHAQDYLGIPVTDWQEACDVSHEARASQEHVNFSQERINDLQCAARLLDSRSVLDLFDGNLTAALSVRIASALTPTRASVQQADVVRVYFTKSEPNHLTRDDLLDAFEPMMIEKPTFPPALGRLAPSLDGPTSTIATEIAPYIRSIVAFDQRLQQQREAMAGDLQGTKVRKTRAARAALEGGSKANTRREIWFSGSTDSEKVMHTAGKDWPIWTQNEPFNLTQSQESVDASSPETDTS